MLGMIDSSLGLGSSVGGSEVSSAGGRHLARSAVSKGAIQHVLALVLGGMEERVRVAHQTPRQLQRHLFALLKVLRREERRRSF